MGLLKDILKIAVGTAIGNSAIDKLKKKGLGEYEKERDLREQAKERERRHREAVESQRNWDAVKKANDERRRKGQPELPYPPRKWY